MNRDGLLIKPTPGQDLRKTIFSAAWVGRLVDAATASPPPAPAEERGIELLQCAWEEEPVSVPSYSLVGALGINATSLPAVEPRPRLQGTLGRSNFLFYTKSDNHGDALLVAFPIPTSYPIRLRVEDPATLMGYQRKYIEGLPCGRKPDSHYVAADQGGLILISKPFRDVDETGDYYCWAIQDTVQTWDAVVVKPSSSSDYVTATNFLTGRGKFVAALLSAKPDQLDADKNKDIITKYRCTVHMRDPADSYEDGTYIQIQYRNSEWKVMWSSCAPVSGLTGQAKEPA